MLFLFFALMSAADAPSASASATPLELDLVCPGEYLDKETSTGDTGGYDANGNWKSGTVEVEHRVRRTGVARIKIRGAKGQIFYPAGDILAIDNVSADSQHISGRYKQLGGLITWHVDINRMTGAVEMRNGSTIALTGTCSPAPPEPVQPKF